MRSIPAFSQEPEELPLDISAQRPERPYGCSHIIYSLERNFSRRADHALRATCHIAAPRTLQVGADTFFYLPSLRVATIRATAMGDLYEDFDLTITGSDNVVPYDFDTAWRTRLGMTAEEVLPDSPLASLEWFDQFRHRHPEIDFDKITTVLCQACDETIAHPYYVWRAGLGHLPGFAAMARMPLARLLMNPPSKYRRFLRIAQ